MEKHKRELTSYELEERKMRWLLILFTVFGVLGLVMIFVGVGWGVSINSERLVSSCMVVFEHKAKCLSLLNLLD